MSAAGDHVGLAAYGAAGRVRRALREAWLGSPLYQVRLAGPIPGALIALPGDPVPGDAARGQALASAVTAQPVASGEAALAWSEAEHAFSGLHDLAACGPEAAVAAQTLIGQWIARHDRRYHPLAWRADVTATRLVAWLSDAPFVLQDATEAFSRRFHQSLARQARHLALASMAEPDAARSVAVAKGLICAGAALPDGGPRIQLGLRHLERILRAQILADGGHLSRSPALQHQVLRGLVAVRRVLRVAQVEVPKVLQDAIDRMAPMLRTLRLGDGGLALFNGSGEGDGWLIDQTLAEADVTGKALMNATHSGFQRLQRGRTAVVMDVGAPSTPEARALAHAGTLSFEMSVGRERLVGNCGARPHDPAWDVALRGSAAHSTVTVGSTNIFAVDAGGASTTVPSVTCHRDERDGAILVEASHDGYRAVLGVLHRRSLYLSSDGHDLRGEDVLEGGAGRSFTIRFHLHPEIKASRLEDGATVLLRLPNGAGFRLRAGGAALALADSVYLGREPRRRTTQVVLEGTLQGEPTVVKWAIQRIPAG
ncbi:MAG: hypothetical protein EXQ96_05480 [Alphaproteobacteria bacterium]|nr:hypothetical protein [Alphaproteobacteria bacterium]